MSVAAILEAEGLTRRFGTLYAVRDVAISVAAGEIKAVIGPNGAGKSTLFNLLTGLPATAGRIRFKGVDITRLPKYRRARMGLVKADQIVSIFPALSVVENVALAIHARRGGVRELLTPFRALAPDHEAAGETLAHVGLADRADQTAGQLSHGDKKRLEVALALSTEPDLLLLDEPTSGMSPRESAMMADLIASVAGGRTILLIEHDIDIVLALSHWVVVMHRGGVLAEGRPEEIEQNARVQEAYLGGYR